MPRDSQKSAVYAWENTIPEKELHGDWTLEQCRALVDRVWADYRPGQRSPEVRPGFGHRNATGSRYTIQLPLWSRQPIVVLHETAHSLLPINSTHGPDFATLLLDLMARYAGVDKGAARKLGIEHKPRRVHFAPAAKVPQPKHTGTRCAKHEWREGELLSTENTTRGRVKVYRLECARCRKSQPERKAA